MSRKLYAALIAVVVLGVVIAMSASRFSVDDLKSLSKAASPGGETTSNQSSGSSFSGRTLPLSAATSADLATAFVFSSVVIFPNADLIYVQRADALSGQADLIDSSGRWIAAADYYPPNFSGDPSFGLFPACRKPQLCGYIGNDGMWVIEPRFHREMPFVNGIAAVYTDNKTMHYIDTKGNPVESNRPLGSALEIADDWFIDQGSSTWHIRDSQGVWHQASYGYDSVASFSKELVIAEKSGLRMLVDRFGKARSPAYESIGSAKEGRAVVALKGKWGVINAKGEWMVAPVYDFLAMNPDGAFQAVRDGHFVLMTAEGEVMSPENGYFAISMPNEGLTAACQGVRCGYLDESGKWAISPQFDYAFRFSEGVARVIKYGLLGYIDHEGHWLTPEPSADAAAPRHWWPAALSGSRIFGESAVFGQLNREGQFTQEIVFSDLGKYAEGLTPAISLNGKWGYLDEGQKWAIPPVFREARPFSEGLAMVKGGAWAGGSISYIDVSGRIRLVPPPIYQTVGDFSSGHAALTDYSGKVSLIDMDGRVTPIAAATAPAATVVPKLSPLSVNGGKWGYADSEDHFVIEPQFDEVRAFAGDYAAVRVGETWGFIDHNGKFVIDALYAEVGKWCEGRVRVRQGSEWIYLDREGHPVGDNGFMWADDFQSGRARVALSINQARQRLIADYKDAEFNSNYAPMLIDGGDMKRGIASVRLAGWQNASPTSKYYWHALLNRRGELVLPEPRPKSASTH